MITGDEILLIIGMMLATFVSRYPPLVIVGRVELSENMFRALRYVPVAVLTAITIPEMVIRDGNITLTPQNAYLVAGIVAIIIAGVTKNLLWTIIGGMSFFMLWRMIFAG